MLSWDPRRKAERSVPGPWGKTMRDAGRNKERWKRRRTPTPDPSTDLTRGAGGGERPRASSKRARGRASAPRARARSAEKKQCSLIIACFLASPRVLQITGEGVPCTREGTPCRVAHHRAACGRPPCPPNSLAFTIRICYSIWRQNSCAHFGMKRRVAQPSAAGLSVRAAAFRGHDHAAPRRPRGVE